MSLLSTALSALVVLAVLVSLAVVYRIDRPGGRWGERLRGRLVMGVPWGTLVTVLFVLSVYLFVQGGYRHWSNPVTVAFRAWSFLYPLGMVTAPFSHTGPGHLIGNLVGTLVLGSISEYAWGHFPTDRGVSTFSSLRTNPWARALVVFPGVAIVAGLLGSVLSIGPVIGFSLVVFAFAGFALARYPLGTIVGVAASDAVGTAYYSLLRPIVTANPQPSPPSPPWWAEIAIQGHALGLLLGVLLGAFLFSRRGESPPALHVWTGVALYAMSRALWAVYWFRGSDTFVLYRGPGVVLVAALALLVTAGATASDRRVFAGLRRVLPSRGGTGDPTVEADGGSGGPGDGGTRAEDRNATGSETGAGPQDDAGGRIRSWIAGLARMTTWRRVALVALLLTVGLLGVPGIATNLWTVADASPPGESVAAGDYEVTYAEGVTNSMVAVVNVSAFNETTTVETSGVIVTSADRRIWYQAVSKGQLAFDGVRIVTVGGVGWRKSVVAIRRGWSASGGSSAYKVWLRPRGEERRFVFNSSPGTASPTIRGRNVSVLAPPDRDGFYLRVSRNDSTLGTAPIPDSGNATATGGLRLVNRGGTVYAIANGTRVQVASKEEYE